jgi:hypothetical protein
MAVKARTSPLVLFFDCFIVSSKLGVEAAHAHRDSVVGNLIRDIRLTHTAYHHVSKLDEVRYTLLSYRAVPWDQMYLRVECEDEDDRLKFFEFARRHFPDADIANQRSATAAQYVQSLSRLKRFGNPWVFFSPNNDHPLIGDPNSFAPLIDLAEDVEPLYPNHFVCILYSHFTESQNSALPEQHNWGRTMGNTYTVAGETAHASIVQSVLFSCDSIKIYRLSSLLTIFGKTTNSGRCIRLEDTDLYLSTQYREINIWPKAEICRHFDGYPHVDRAPPPLFVPPGFFESDIRIRYGFEDHQVGCVSVNPFEELSYLGGTADIRCLLSEIPGFWKERISSIAVDPNMASRYAGRVDDAFQFGSIRNPYSDSSVMTNYKRSAWNAMGNKAKEFDEKLCTASLTDIPAGFGLIDKSTSSATSVYFVLTGVVTTGDMQFRKNDFLIVSGDIGFQLEALAADAKILKVLIEVGGPLMLKVQIWRTLPP